MIPAETRFGNENQMGAEWKAQLYGMGPAGKEVHITQIPMEKMRVLNKNSTPARHGIAWGEGGGWSNMNVELLEGTILKLFIARKRLQGIPLRAAILFRVRADAPLIQVTCPGLAHGDSTQTDCVALFGKFDKVSLDEGRALGYSSQPVYDKFFNSIDEEDLMTMTTIEIGVPAPRLVVESVETVDGTKQIIKPAELRRVRKRPKK